MGKNGIKPIKLIPANYDTCDEDYFDIMTDLYKNHHSTPKNCLHERLPYANYFLVEDQNKQIIGMTSYRDTSPGLMMTERTILYPQYRGQGYGSKISKIVEQFAIENGYRKICCEILTFNLNMVFIKLKQGFIIEGMMRNHDGGGIHQYYLSKEL